MIIGLTCALLCGLLNQTGLLRSLENIALDACFQLRGERTSSAKLLIVSIDDESLVRLNKPFVLASPELATVIRYLSDRGASAIGVDLIIRDSAEMISELRPGRSGDADQMGAAVGESGRVVLSQWATEDGAIGPFFQWQPFIDPQWSDVGYVNFDVDSDKSIRAQQLRALRANERSTQIPSFALAIFGKHASLDAEWFAEPTLTMQGHPIPDHRMLINYLGPPGTIREVPFHRVLDAARVGEAIAEDLSNTVVLIGVNEKVQQDVWATPYSSQSLFVAPTTWFGYEPALMPGVEVHANILATLLDQAYITTPVLLSPIPLLVVFGLVLGMALIRSSLEAGAMITLLHHFGWKLVTIGAFVLFQWRIEMVAMMLLGPMVYATVFALRWRWVRRMMGMFKSESIARAMELNPAALDLKGEEQIVTLLFADIRGFTSISESKKDDPHFVVRLLNDYFTAIVPEIERYGGALNQYMGDGIMVIFGAPMRFEDHAARAVKAGRDIIRKVRGMESHWKHLGVEDFRIGVGIHTGKAITGTVGSPGRLDYSAIGDTVNTAARIESSTKVVGAEMLISQQTREAILPADWESLGLNERRHEISVKGKTEKLTVHALSPVD
jgi:adenylate cyclase